MRRRPTVTGRSATLRLPSRPWAMILLVVQFFISAFFLVGCGNQGHGVVIAGSTSVQPVMEKIADSYRKTFPGRKVTVEGGGSSAGIMAALTGTAHLGMSSRDLKQDHADEKTLTAIPLALDAIAVIVNAENPIQSLTLAQLRELFSGKIRNWQDLGGKHREVHLVVREEGSGTRTAFEELVMKEGKTELPIDTYALVQDSTGGVREVVRTDPGAIGFISLGAVTKQIKAVHVDGVEPTIAAVKAQKYKLVRPFLLVTKGPPATDTQMLIDYALGSAGVKLLLQEGLVGAH
ncbi:MAG TPA: phosphate ABC transporter substrate-binding protein [Candidatus Ozemobacteraceae bacterium]|nr:phosphate ABC transporter substrate-binding protein [Candidatus Ozemobacteraceae bacterium]